MLQTMGSHGDAGGNINDSGSINNLLSKMDKTLKVWQAIMATVLFIISVGSLFFSLYSQVISQRRDIDYLKDADKDKALQIRDLNQQQAQQYKEINQKLTDILVTLQTKENKK